MDEQIVVSNTTPLIALAWLEQLDLLPVLFGTVHIPGVVETEIHYDPTAIGAAELAAATWLVVTPVINRISVTLLLDQLDAGESEAIVLAHELDAGLLLMDERRGRRRATQSGLSVVGTLGILAEARQRGLISSLHPLLERLRQLPFYVSDSLIADVLRRVGE